MTTDPRRVSPPQPPTTDALARMTAIAEEFGVTAQTLGQYATRSGWYARRTKPRSDAQLPGRYTREGEALATRVYEATVPYNPHYVGTGGSATKRARRATRPGERAAVECRPVAPESTPEPPHPPRKKTRPLSGPGGLHEHSPTRQNRTTSGRDEAADHA